MISKEITELRKAGKLDEAKEKAISALQSEPDNIWNKRAASWVYYEYIKTHASEKNYEEFQANLNAIKALNLPEDDKMVFDNCAWQIGSMVFFLSKAESIDFAKINAIFETIRDFHFTRPSEAYSFIYKAFHKSYHNWMQFLEFADWWNFEYFRPEDYLNEEFDGKKIMATAEQAYIAYSKKLLEGQISGPFGNEKELDKDKIETFIPLLDTVIEEYPEYQYPPYFKAKMLIALGDENVLSTFLPFAKQKRNDFWVWELMAEIFHDDKEIQFACYCKALSLKTPEDFLVKLRLTFAGILVERKMYDEAKTEIERIVKTREKHEWKLPNQITQWTEQDWYKSANSKKNNIGLYSQHIKQAEEILFQDIPEEIVVVEFVNENKHILNFVKDRQRFGFFSYAGYLEKPVIGDTLKVRFNGDGKESFFKVLSATQAPLNSSTEAMKIFEGNLKLVSPQNFGFIEDVFLDPNLIQNGNFLDGQTLSGRAILSYNKKKNEWGWKAVSIEA